MVESGIIVVTLFSTKIMPSSLIALIWTSRLAWKPELFLGLFDICSADDTVGHRETEGTCLWLQLSRGSSAKAFILFLFCTLGLNRRVLIRFSASATSTLLVSFNVWMVEGDLGAEKLSLGPCRQKMSKGISGPCKLKSACTQVETARTWTIAFRTIRGTETLSFLKQVLHRRSALHLPDCFHGRQNPSK